MASGKNASYNKGVRKERGFVNRARQMGQFSFRSAGSHSIVDVVIFDWQRKVVHCIQSKPDSMSHTARLKLIKEAEEKYHLCGKDWTVEFGVA